PPLSRVGLSVRLAQRRLIAKRGLLCLRERQSASGGLCVGRDGPAGNECGAASRYQQNREAEHNRPPTPGELESGHRLFRRHREQPLSWQQKCQWQRANSSGPALVALSCFRTGVASRGSTPCPYPAPALVRGWEFFLLRADRDENAWTEPGPPAESLPSGDFGTDSPPSTPAYGGLAAGGFGEAARSAGAGRWGKRAECRANPPRVPI